MSTYVAGDRKWMRDADGDAVELVWLAPLGATRKGGELHMIRRTVFDPEGEAVRWSFVHMSRPAWEALPDGDPPIWALLGIKPRSRK